MFSVDDVQREYDRMKAAGAEFTMSPTKVIGSTIGEFTKTVRNKPLLERLSQTT